MDPEFSQQLQTEAYSIISSNNDEPMETLFSHLLSVHEPHRSQAINLFNCCKKHYPSVLFIKLFYLLRHSPTAATRANAARVFQLVQVRDLWPKLTPNAQTNLKALILDCLKQEDSVPNLRVLCAIVSEMVCEIYKENDQWQDLIDFLVNCCVQSGSEKFEEVALLVFANLSMDCRVPVGEALSPYLELLQSAFVTKLGSTNIDIQMAAFGAVVSLIRLFSRSSSDYWFRGLLKAMMVGVFNLLTRSQANYAQKSLETMMILAIEEPQILRPYLNNLVSYLIKIAESQLVKDEVRLCAVKFLIVMSEAKDLAPLMRVLPQEAMLKMLSIPMTMLLGIRDDLAWYQTDHEHNENAGKISTYKFGIEGLTKFAVSFGEKRIVPIALQFLSRYVDEQEWQKRHAGITMLAVLAKECSDEMVMMEDYMDRALTILLKSFKDSHPRVRWAAFNFMNLSLDLVQAIQILYHQRIFPALLSGLSENQNPKVKEQAASALLYFMNNIPLDCLRVYMDLDYAMSKLLELLKSGDRTDKAKSIALSTFNIIAQLCQEVALRHYVNYLPLCLEACNDKNTEVKQEAIRGIRICAMSGRPEFKPFVIEAISKLGTVLGCQDRSCTEDAKAYDIAVSALGKICEFHRDNIDGTKLVPTWLSLLPVKEDLTEAKIVHEQLCSMVEKLDRQLLGPKNQYVAKVITVFLEVINAGNNLATEQTMQRMTNMLKQICRVLPRDLLDGILAYMDEQQQKSLLAVVHR